MQDEETAVEEIEQDAEPPAGDEESQGESQEAETPAGEETSQGEEEEELQVSFADEEEKEEKGQSFDLLNDLRKRLKDNKKKLRKATYELEQAKKTTEQETTPLGQEPTIEGCEYDEEVYRKRYADWYQRKYEQEQQQQQKAKQREQEELEQRRIQENYTERKKTLRVKDYADAEEEVVESLDITKQFIIMKYAKKPELIVYALGKSPAKLAELSKLDAYEFTKELGRLEDNLKVGKRKPKTQPEKTIQSTGTLSGTTDRTLDKLREEAAKTGNMSKVMAYKRKKRRATS